MVKKDHTMEFPAIIIPKGTKRKQFIKRLAKVLRVGT